MNGETSNTMASVAARYQTQVTVFATTGANVELILKADPRRYYVKFVFAGFFAVTYPLMPGPPNNALVGGGFTVETVEFKFRDCPSIVTGEWYFGAAAGANVAIIECLYVE